MMLDNREKLDNHLRKVEEILEVNKYGKPNCTVAFYMALVALCFRDKNPMHELDGKTWHTIGNIALAKEVENFHSKLWGKFYNRLAYTSLMIRHYTHIGLIEKRVNKDTSTRHDIYLKAWHEG